MSGRDTLKHEEVRRNPTRLGERLTEAMREIAKENPDLAGVIDIVDFNFAGHRQPGQQQGAGRSPAVRGAGHGGNY